MLSQGRGKWQGEKKRSALLSLPAAVIMIHDSPPLGTRKDERLVQLSVAWLEKKDSDRSTTSQ